MVTTERGACHMSTITNWAEPANINIFMADISEWGAMNEVYRTYFEAQEAPPARSAFGANGLALGARVEIDCIAVLD